jgi:predicted transcriptional regulator
MPAKGILHGRLARQTLRKLDAAAVLDDLQAGLEEGRAGKGIPHDKAMRRIDGAIERARKRRDVGRVDYES